jgi:very-short-patch-repair endonuclease
VWVNGRQVDIYFPDHNLIVELDGWDYHKDRHAFETDRERDAHQLAHGLRTLRITRDRFKGDPDREAARLQQILDQA